PYPHLPGWSCVSPRREGDGAPQPPSRCVTSQVQGCWRGSAGRSVSVRPIPVALFLDNLQYWQAAFDSGRLDDHRRAADEIAFLGRVLVSDPGFRRLFERHRIAMLRTDDVPEAVAQLFLPLTDTAVPGENQTAPPPS